MNLEIVLADYTSEQHSTDIISLLNDYALDPMGGNEGLSDFVKENLIAELSKNDNALTILAYIESKPVGLVNCFKGFSTFKCKPLLNIHDVVVLKEYRGLGVCEKMLSEVERVARDQGCCKLTLEVLEGNKSAQSAYTKYGFEGYELDPSTGKALFWQKSF